MSLLIDALRKADEAKRQTQANNDQPDGTVLLDRAHLLEWESVKMPPASTVSSSLDTADDNAVSDDTHNAPDTLSDSPLILDWGVDTFDVMPSPEKPPAADNVAPEHLSSETLSEPSQWSEEASLSANEAIKELSATTDTSLSIDWSDLLESEEEENSTTAISDDDEKQSALTDNHPLHEEWIGVPQPSADVDTDDRLSPSPDAVRQFTSDDASLTADKTNKTVMADGLTEPSEPAKADNLLDEPPITESATLSGTVLDWGDVMADDVAPEQPTKPLVADSAETELSISTSDDDTKTDNELPWLPELAMDKIDLQTVQAQLAQYSAANTTIHDPKAAQRVFKAKQYQAPAQSYTVLYISLAVLLLTGGITGWYFQDDLLSLSSPSLVTMNEESAVTTTTELNTSNAKSETALIAPAISPAETQEKSTPPLVRKNKSAIQAARSITDKLDSFFGQLNTQKDPVNAGATTAEALATSQPDADPAPGKTPEINADADDKAILNSVRASPQTQTSKTALDKSSTYAFPPPSREAVHTAEDIQITRHNRVSTGTDTTRQQLKSAFDALMRGDETRAQADYQRVLRRKPGNRDALLGMALIAMRNNQPAVAANYYHQVLRRYPRDTVAQAALSLLDSRSAPEQENRLQALIQQSPQSGGLHFALGQLYAGQNRWTDAQQAFFNAWRLHKNNADYAYSLAVSLDRLQQSAAASHYYQLALQIAAAKPFTFNTQQVRQRLQKLATERPDTPTALDRLTNALTISEQNNE